jgi:hypothetical protein
MLLLLSSHLTMKMETHLKTMELGQEVALVAASVILSMSKVTAMRKMIFLPLPVLDE